MESDAGFQGFFEQVSEYYIVSEVSEVFGNGIKNRMWLTHW